MYIILRFEIQTNLNEYKINMNSIINFTSDFITYYSLNNDQFVYHKILDVDENSIITVDDYNRKYTYKDFLINLGITKEKTPSSEKTTKEEKQENKTKNETANKIQIQQMRRNRTRNYTRKYNNYRKFNRKER
ncbi:MAG: hypothetical protein ACLS5Y_06850 [Clostridia bacterium]